MRQRPNSTPRKIAQSTPIPEIDALKAQADTAAATRLLQLSLGEDRVVAKAARTALHALKQAGIVPEPIELPATARPEPPRAAPPAYRAWVCHPTPQGKVYLTCAAPTGSGRRHHVWLAEIQLVDRALELTEGLQAADGFEAFLANVLSDDKAPAQETSLEQARMLVTEACELVRRSGGLTPAGYHAWIASMGKPDPSTRPRVYDLLDAESVLADLSISREPEEALKCPQREGWMLPPDTMEPWLGQILKAFESALAIDDAQRKRLAERAFENAADGIFDADTRWIWRRMLEESAAALASMGDMEAARMGLYHALQFDDRPARDIPMAMQLVRRTASVLIMLAAKRAGQQMPDDEIEDDDDQPPSLIQRV